MQHELEYVAAFRSCRLAALHQRLGFLAKSISGTSCGRIGDVLPQGHRISEIGEAVLKKFTTVKFELFLQQFEGTCYITLMQSFQG